MDSLDSVGRRGASYNTMKEFSQYDTAYFKRLDHWSGSEEYRREVDQIIQPLNLKRGDKVLDVGCCSGNAGLHVSKTTGCDVFGVDAVEEFVRRCKIKAVLGDAQQLPFEDASFDAVYILHVIGHVARPQKVLQEVKRVLKPGGRLAVITPNRNFVYAMKILNYLGIVKHTPDGTILRYYTTSSLAQDITQSGLSVKTVYTYGALPNLLMPFGDSRLTSSFRKRVIAIAAKEGDFGI